MSKAGSLTGLFSMVEYQYGSFSGFECFLVGVIRCKFPLFKPVKVRAKEIWSWLELFMDWLLRVRSETIPRGQLWGVLTVLIKKKSHTKCVWQKVKITESLPTPAGCLLSRLCMSFQMNGRLLAKIYRREGKRKRVKYFFFFNKRGNNINWHRTRRVALVHLYSLPPWEHKMLCCTKGSAGREPTAAGITVPWLKTWAVTERGGQIWGPKEAITASL